MPISGVINDGSGGENGSLVDSNIDLTSLWSIFEKIKNSRDQNGIGQLVTRVKIDIDEDSRQDL